MTTETGERGPVGGLRKYKRKNRSVPKMKGDKKYGEPHCYRSDETRNKIKRIIAEL